MTGKRQTDRFLEKWGRAMGLSRVESGSDLVGLFQHFRPNGHGVDDLFVGIEHGDEIVSRLMRCYKCTQGTSADDAYFVPRSTNSMTDSEVEEKLRQHLSSMREVAAFMRDEEVARLVEAASIRKVIDEDELNAAKSSDESLEVWLFDMVGDFCRKLDSRQNPAELLIHAAYSIANNAYVRGYVLWPMYAASAGVVDPFRAYFECWEKGVRCRFVSNDTLGFCFSCA